MNHRCKQLAIQAGLYVDFNGKPWPKWLAAEGCEIAYKKFAELMIKDCVQTMVNHGYTDAAQCLESAYAEDSAEDWQSYSFPEI
jgi:hypothetical protein